MFGQQPGWNTAQAPSVKVTPEKSPRKPQESPQLRRVQRLGSYAEAIRSGRSAMTHKREKSVLTVPIMSSGEYEAAVDAFIRTRGVTRCPTACLVRTQASVPAADRAALERYEAGREQSRRQHIAATARLLGVVVPPPDAR
jgi:hypothetical protein